MARILLVEDDPVQARLLSVLLREAGFDIQIAGDAERAHQYVLEQRFDAVLSDLLLPGESGFDLCRRIKTDPRHRAIPVILLTSQVDPGNVLRGLEVGADGFMTKNRPPTENIGRLERILARRQHAQASPIPPERTRVVFLDQEFEFAATHEQLLNVLLAAFEDVVHVNRQYEKSELALRKLNAQLKEAFEQLKKAESQLVQAEKLSSLGKMVAGVAHEINNPLAFLRSNIAVLERDTGALGQLISMYQEIEEYLTRTAPEVLRRVHDFAAEIDLSYTLDNLPRLLSRSADGLQRIQRIVKNLKDFARLDESERKRVNVNDGVEATIAIMRDKAEIRQVQITAELQPLPEIVCHPAKINQVMMNLIDNAIDACPAAGSVFVRTHAKSDTVVIEVTDTGRGIDPAIRAKIFDPFFTTKPPGMGTGLGLSIAYGIVQDHHGTIDAESVVGSGTTMRVSLPIGDGRR